MQLDYFAETDTLYIRLRDTRSKESQEVAENVVLDFDEAGTVVGIEIEHAAARFDLSTLVSETLPLRERKAA